MANNSEQELDTASYDALKEAMKTVDAMEDSPPIPVTRTISIGGAHSQPFDHRRIELLGALKAMKTELEARLKTVNDWIGDVERRF